MCAVLAKQDDMAGGRQALNGGRLVPRRGLRAGRRASLAGAAALAAFGGAASAQPTAASHTTGAVAIVEPATMAEANPLSLGTIVVPESGRSSIRVEVAAGDLAKATGAATEPSDMSRPARYTFAE